MNLRERRMAIILGVLVVLGAGGFFGYQMFVAPWQQQEQSLRRLQDETDEKLRAIALINKDLPKLASWRLLSLPSDPVQAQREYGNYLSKLLKDNNWHIESFNPGASDVKQGPQLPNKKPVYTALTYTIRAQTDQANLVKFLQEFHKTPLMHKIKSLILDRPATTVADAASAKGGFGKGKKGGKEGDKLTVNLTVEALIVNGSEKRWTNLTGIDDRLVALDALAGLQRAPIGLAQVPWAISPNGVRPPQVLAKTILPREYSNIARRDIFTAPRDPFGPKTNVETVGDITRYVYLIIVSLKDGRQEAWLRDRLQNKEYRIRPDDKSGFQNFRIVDEEGNTAVKGKLVLLLSRDAYFEVDNEIYAIHVGDQSMYDAMRRPVPEEELLFLGLR
jgi:hypothetical protein